MPQSTSSEPVRMDLIGDARLSAVLACIAGAVLLVTPLINSPSVFSERHYRDSSWLRPLVSALGLNGAFPTVRGVEIRNLVYYCGAALLSGLAGAYLIFTRARPRHSLDDLFHIRERAKNPYFWWVILLLVSLLSSNYAHAPQACFGQTTIRFMHFAWWFPLAVLLQPRHVRRLCGVLLLALLMCGAMGIWYHARRSPDFWATRLQYPIGNELWMAACVMPAILLGLGLFRWRSTNVGAMTFRPAWFPTICAAVAVSVGLTVIFLTRSRSATAGLVAGIFAFAYFLAARRMRPIILLLALGLGIAGALAAQQRRASGIMGQRAESIRSRLNYEWPYAIKLFTDKPVAGNGDGAYSMLAGQYARADQLEDPSILRTENYWTAHAHNEFLELLADLGIAGMLAFAAAIGLTLLYAARYCLRPGAADLRSGSADSHKPNRILVAGLGAALVALVIDQCTETALREPGLPPIFFAIWAMLWALVRRERLAKFKFEENERLPNYLLRWLGGGILLGAAYLGWAGIRDWQGARGRFEAQAGLNAQDYERGMHQADTAGTWLLDPFQRNQARMLAITARSLTFDQALAQTSGPLGSEQMEIGRRALVELGGLKADAPRFLQVSRLEVALCLNAARAFERRRDVGSAQGFQRRFLAALEQCRLDEPFVIDHVFSLWQAKTTAGVLERIGWLRALIRGGAIDRQVDELLQQLITRPDFAGAMNDLINIAMQDAAKSPESWRDPMSPETLRLAARSEALGGRSEKAARTAETAEQLYERAGARLFAAHAALLHEWVNYDLAANGSAGTDANLARLAKAWSISQFPVGAAEALPGELGQTRLRVLELAHRENEAGLQREKLAGH